MFIQDWTLQDSMNDSGRGFKIRLSICHGKGEMVPTGIASLVDAQMCPHGLLWICLSELSTTRQGWGQQLSVNQAGLAGRENTKLEKFKVLMKTGIYFYTLHSIRKHMHT